jgi:signal transduction histidine kinase
MREGLVLVVEDDRARRNVAGRLLRAAGFEVLECGTGREGLELARARQPDLVLLDVLLPDLDGREVCRLLKADPSTAGIVVLHLSAAYATTADAVAGLESGADGYLTHPAEPDYLVATVRAFVRARRAERRAEEQMRSLNETLERQVAERTAELLAYQQRLRALVAELGRTEQRERHRVAADLHDNLAQLLAACKMRVAAVSAAARAGTRAAADAAEAVRLLGEGIEYTRSLMADLSPPVVQGEGLDAALEWAVQRAEKQGLRVRVTSDGLPKPVADDVRLLLLQGVRELLLNVVKHAGTAEAAVAVERDGGEVRLTVEDGGCGFTGGAAVAPHASGGFGLFSLRERLQLVGGRVDVVSQAGRGTKVVLTAPLTQPDPDVGAAEATGGWRAGDPRLPPPRGARGGARRAEE